MSYIDSLYALTTVDCPKGYREDHEGNLRRIDRIKPLDLERDALTRDLFSQAILVHEEMLNLAHQLRFQVAQFVKMAMAKYDKHLGGQKGNVTLYSIDRRIKIERSRQDRVCFNENAIAARRILDECIKRWSKGSNKNLQAVVQSAFKTDKNGRFSAAKVLSLRSLDIDDPQWKEGMNALADAIEVDSSAEYFRVYYRDDNGNYHQLPLDLANITADQPEVKGKALTPEAEPA
ncbi:DUF3164 family protein [Alteromonas confluentis]|uniref:Sulfate transporter n=1 Tax=Alteromonas confluentis TaxID=1656094 RepID=A0A1E7ZE51_9ALTE|nr:DUF3164 family protein [Alteromonas confluentis]OFC71785.1 hypothetical protein BFC18_06425 [Alteromonas confluentis]